MNEKALKKLSFDFAFYQHRLLWWLFSGVVLLFIVLFINVFIEEGDYSQQILSIFPWPYFFVIGWTAFKIITDSKRLLLAADRQGVYWRENSKEKKFQQLAWTDVHEVKFYGVDEGDSESSRMVYYYELQLTNDATTTLTTRGAFYQYNNVVTFYHYIQDRVEETLSQDEAKDTQELLESLGEIRLYASDIPSLKAFVKYPKANGDPEIPLVKSPRLKSTNRSIKTLFFPLLISVLIPLLMPLLIAYFIFVSQTEKKQVELAEKTLESDYQILLINRQNFFYRQLNTGEKDFFEKPFNIYSFNWQDVKEVRLKKGDYSKPSHLIKEEVSPYYLMVRFNNQSTRNIPLPAWDFKHFSAKSLKEFLNFCFLHHHD